MYISACICYIHIYAGCVVNIDNFALYVFPTYTSLNWSRNVTYIRTSALCLICYVCMCLGVLYASYIHAHMTTNLHYHSKCIHAPSTPL